MRYHFQILSAPDGSSDSLIMKDAKMGDGVTSQLDDMHEFDGSVVVHEFSIPPEWDEMHYGEDVIHFEFTPIQAWVLAKQVHRGFMEGRFEEMTREDDGEDSIPQYITPEGRTG